jgi:heptosyltransferase-2
VVPLSPGLITRVPVQKDCPEKILILRLSSIGDIILTTPLIRLLRRKFPSARIDYVLKKKFAPLLEDNPNLDRLITFDTAAGWRELVKIRSQIKKSQYDLIIDIHKNFRSFFMSRFLPGIKVVVYRKYILKRVALVLLGWNFYQEIIPVPSRYLESVAEYGIRDDNAGPEFFPQKSTLTRMKEEIRNHGLISDRLTIGIAAGAGFETKRWPEENYTRVALSLKKSTGAQALLFGDKGDRVITEKIRARLGPDAIDLAGQLSLMETACAIDQCDLVLSNDTGLMHLAAALKKKTLAIFGPTTREFGFFPQGHHTRVVEHPHLTCRPCTHLGSRSCPKDHFRCMKEISPETVVSIAMEMITAN